MSPIHRLLSRLVELGPRGHAVIDAVAAEMPAHELAALAYAWDGVWARSEQEIPQAPFRSFGTMTGRGWGKTRTSVSFALGEVEAGRARRIALVGQSEAKTIEILVEGETGILELCPPWLGAVWESSSNRVRFGNGAIATVYTAQEPTGLRGPQHDLALATELASWPASTRSEAFECLWLGLRLGYGKLLWDSTPKRRNPLIRQLLSWNANDPAKHLLVRGSTFENAINLSPGVVAEWQATWGGTARGEEELEGRFLDDAENAYFKQAWIEKSRRRMPEKLKRRIISIDPAITENPKYSDATGIIDMGLGVDDQVYVLANLSGVHRAEVWPGMVIDTYLRGSCDLILVESNRGGTAWAALLRVAARDRGLTLIELGPLEVPGNRPGVVYMRAHNVKGSKAARAAGAAALCERSRVSFVPGALGDLEDRLCSFDGSEKGPDDAIDSFSAGCHELAALATDKPDPLVGWTGILEANAAIASAPRPGLNPVGGVGGMRNLAQILGGTSRGAGGFNHPSQLPYMTISNGELKP